MSDSTLYGQLRAIAPDDDPEAATLNSLQDELISIKNQLAGLAEQGASRARQLATDTTESARGLVREYPLASMAVLFILGGLIALAVIPSVSKKRSKVQEWTDDMSHFTDKIQRSIRNSVRQSGMMDNLERVGSALSSVDAKETIAPVVDRLLNWFGQARDKVNKAVKDHTAAS